MTFRWDAGKDRANRTKHGVALADAVRVFDDPLAITRPDPLHSIGEDRFVVVGMAADGPLLVVTYSEESGDTRLINARPATKRERHAYERQRP